ncbi:SMC family ATPase [Arthrobacter sp. efr-133-TYG-104]|uniref:AAA family ATPase n=1 Tax=Arthrobacter sp. efr-133-TYG-104 TaxID=3040324 RepID=UPI00255010EA|nr:SMC family ATPase [Arthrobacter sp. efr-133-TYG-104]
MRIHRLDLEAFGPFAAKQHIDFDQLGAQGLFLLNGATGAGKTSVLDAICFALYGSVPGARQEGKRLRSDHAAPGVEPHVVCEFSARGRRFEVTRSPAWDRPSARGRKGFTTQQAKTLLRERVAGNWIEKSSRNDEVGAELSDVLGMDRDQFTRVVMLPQGDFAAFLRSKAGDRLDLLQKLFGTQRFEAVEKQVALQAADAARAVEQNARHLDNLLDRAAGERDHLGLPAFGEAGGSAVELDQAARAPEPEAWLEALEAEIAAETERRQAHAKLAEARARQREEQLQHDVQKAKRHARLAAGMQRRVLLELAAPPALEKKDKLARHRRAAVLSGHLEALDTAVGIFHAARDRKDHAVERLEAAALDVSDPKAALETTNTTLAVLDARLPDEQRLEQVTAQLASRRDELERLGETASEAAASLDELTAEETAVTAGIELLEPVAARHVEVQREAEAAEHHVDLVIRHAASVQELDVLTESHAQARTESQDLRQAWLDVREARLANAAGELAAALIPGQPCAVCGSHDHPAPAAAAQSALSIAQDEQEAERAFQASEQVLGQIAADLSAATERVAGLAAQGGSDELDEAEHRLASWKAAVVEAREASQALEKLRAKHELLTGRIVLVKEQLSETRQASVQASSAADMLQEQFVALEATLTTLRRDFPSLRERSEALSAQRMLLQTAVDAVAVFDHADKARLEAAAALDKALPGAGFASAEDARRELLSASDVVALETDLAEFDAEAARIEELFASEDLSLASKEVGIGDLPLPAAELDAARAAAAVAGEEARNVALAAGLAEKAEKSVGRIRAEYVESAQSGKEPRQRAGMLSGLAETVRGAGENSYRMSLNSYVLAARLEQVAVAASERLVAMSDGRYTLRHTDARAARNQKSGLGLEVVDEWTGQQRDTATLSGGESFMASLALALGLADVVQQEAGGVDIETLFVDEGFGSLDEQALEQVMDALEGLRDGGRVVGLVSHVAEMKQRIQTQLQVVKGRHGSSVHIAGAGPS